MTAQLGERLRELAEDAPGALHAPDLWAAGRARHRRRVVTALAVVGAVVALAAGVGLGDWRSRQPAPAAPPATDSGPMAIPDRFYAPSPWLPSTSAPGRLVAIIDGVEQHHVFGGPTEGLVGVAAGSQRYTFLDLPGSLKDTSVSLAPDGRHIAYEIPGPTTKKRDDGQIGGFAVLDLERGTTQRYLVSTEHGVNTTTFGWLSSGTLLVTAVFLVDASPRAPYASHVSGQYFRIDVEASRLWRAHRSGIGGAYGVMSLPHALAFLSAPDRVTVLGAPTGVRIDSIHLSRQLSGGALSAARDRVAGVRNGGHLRVFAGRIVDGRAALQRVPAPPGVAEVLAWLDAHHVLAVRSRYPRGPVSSQERLVSLDVRTGAAAEIGPAPAGELTIAGDALAQPHFVRAAAAQRPWNRRTELWCLAVGLVVIGGIGARLLLRGRSRVRR